MPAELDVWLHGVRVATLREVRTRKLRLDYTDAAADAFRIGAPVLSVAMPLNTHRRYPPGIVDPWLEGLLPEGEARTSIERTYGVLRGDAVGLLSAVGRDCAGAVVIQPPGQAPPSTVGGLAAVALSPQDLADELGRLGHRPLGADRSVRVSLAGQQPKLLLTRTSSGVWARPTADAPSTWILKPQDERLPGMVRNEAACVTAGMLLGLGDIHVEVLDVAGRDVLAVARYDRDVDADGSVIRRHQEDLSQALGLASHSDAKYQDAGERAPSLRAAAEILDTWAADAEAALIRLARGVAFNVAIGNADAHAKNLSFLHRSDGTVELAPLYDVASTIHYPTLVGRLGPVPISRHLALRVGSATTLDVVSLDDLVAESQSWGMGRTMAHRVARSTLNAVVDAMEQAVERFGADPAISATVRARVEALLAGLPAGTHDPTRPGA